MTDEQALRTMVQADTTDVPGRALTHAGHHHFIIDSAHGPNEEITPIDVFLAGIASCAVHQVERFAPDAGLDVQHATAVIEGFRNPEDTARFTHIDLHLELHGVTQSEAESLVELFKGR